MLKLRTYKGTSVGYIYKEICKAVFDSFTDLLSAHYSLLLHIKMSF